jgi:hypothetical protein
MHMQGDSTHVRTVRKEAALDFIRLGSEGTTYHDHREFILAARLLLGSLDIGNGLHMETVFEVLRG